MAEFLSGKFGTYIPRHAAIPHALADAERTISGDKMNGDDQWPRWYETDESYSEYGPYFHAEWRDDEDGHGPEISDITGYFMEADGSIYDPEQEEADRLPHGYFFHIAGKHRPMESVRFYLAIHDAGLPVIISTAEEILARYEGTDYIGIVQHSETPKYCESMFPAKYGRVIDFTHVYKDEDEWFGQIEWIPEKEAELVKR